MNKQFFSINSGISTFIKSNILLILVFLTFMVNKGEWGYDGTNFVILFIVVAEAFIIALSFIACFKKQVSKKIKEKEKKNKKEWFAFGITCIFLSLFSLIFLGANIPYPSTLIFLMLISNAMFAAYSVLFHPISLGIYEANVFQEKKTIFDYIFKYVAIFLSGINYYVQITFLKLPLLVNKLLAIVFVLILLWQWFGVIPIFDK